jgi:hypothetical protein
MWITNHSMRLSFLKNQSYQYRSVSVGKSRIGMLTGTRDPPYGLFLSGKNSGPFQLVWAVSINFNQFRQV